MIIKVNFLQLHFWPDVVVGGLQFVDAQFPFEHLLNFISSLFDFHPIPLTRNLLYSTVFFSVVQFSNNISTDFEIGLSDTDKYNIHLNIYIKENKKIGRCAIQLVHHKDGYPLPCTRVNKQQEMLFQFFTTKIDIHSRARVFCIMN